MPNRRVLNNRAQVVELRWQSDYADVRLKRRGWSWEVWASIRGQHKKFTDLGLLIGGGDDDATISALVGTYFDACDAAGRAHAKAEQGFEDAGAALLAAAPFVHQFPRNDQGVCINLASEVSA